MNDEMQEQVGSVTESPSSEVTASTESSAGITPSVDGAGDSNQTVTTETAKVDEVSHVAKPEISHEDRMVYSFKKQLGKQKFKYEKLLAERDEQIKSFAERLEKLENPDKYRQKYRDDFKTDDEFINHLVEERFNAKWQDALQEYKKQEDERQQREETEKQYRERADENVKRLFTTDEAVADYHAKINDALDKGLGELIDSDKDLAQYIVMSPMGPKIMYELATNVDAVRELFEDATSPLDRQFRVRALEQRLSVAPPVVETKPTQSAPAAQPAQEPPKAVGKPGVGSGTSKSIFDSNDAIIEYLRKF